MNNPTPASLLKKITLKRAALAEAKAAHAVALAECRAASHDLASSDPVDNAFSVSRSHAADTAVFKANALVKRRAYALATLEDALDSARHAAAAARAAADRALHDADLSATAEDRTAYARAVEADEEAAEAVAAPTAPTAADLRAALHRAEAALKRAEARHAEAAAAYPALAAAHRVACEAPRPFGISTASIAARAAREARDAGDRAISRAAGQVKRATAAAFRARRAYEATFAEAPAAAALAAHRLAVEAAAAAPVEVTAETLLEQIAALRGQSLDFFMSRAGRARICLRNNPASRAQATRSLAATLEAMRLNLAARAADSASRKLIEAMETEEDAAAWNRNA